MTIEEREYRHQIVFKPLHHGLVCSFLRERPKEKKPLFFGVPSSGRGLYIMEELCKANLVFLVSLDQGQGHPYAAHLCCCHLSGQLTCPCPCPWIMTPHQDQRHPPSTLHPHHQRMMTMNNHPQPGSASFPWPCR